MLDLTPRQLAALLWLPADGSWTKRPRWISAAVDSLRYDHPRLVDTDFDPRGALSRLTGAGREERKRRETSNA